MMTQSRFIMRQQELLQKIDIDGSNLFNGGFSVTFLKLRSQRKTWMMEWKISGRRALCAKAKF